MCRLRKIREIATFRGFLRENNHLSVKAMLLLVIHRFNLDFIINLVSFFLLPFNVSSLTFTYFIGLQFSQGGVLLHVRACVCMGCVCEGVWYIYILNTTSAGAVEFWKFCIFFCLICFSMQHIGM